jgi:hypothetical protein
MCAQCMMGATIAAAGATGTRAWLAGKSFRWMTPSRLRRATVFLVAVGFVISAVGFHGS